MSKNKSILIQGKTINFPTKLGSFKLTPFKDASTNIEHVCIHKGDWSKGEVILSRVHSSCMTGDIFGSLKCDCGDQLIEAFNRIERAGKGLLIYLQQEGRGIGFMSKIDAYALQEEGFDTVDANLKLGYKVDERDYTIAAEIYKAMNVSETILMTNNPSKVNALSELGVNINKYQKIWTDQNEYNSKYIHTKITRMNHIR